MINSFKGKYRFLSNFYPSPIIIKGITYPTTEHYYQTMKTTDFELRKEIIYASTPGNAKRMGRRVPLRDNWETLKIIIMLQALITKFTTHSELRKKLLETYPQKLIEGNTWGDVYWGKDLRSRKGLNMLGKLLMLVRYALQ